ncbi:hypothetical protein NS226_04190 [Aureimonas ureilytica]|uniref:Bacterial mobilisation domain-containing protein n=1 Tax=Aureimonas ureilytica TaxID=401562 RepID=A0A175RCU7_9HYPH|nr:plasmid mobilization relaxosome protein MobC [Aureimonas ureilytica]KTQ97552.1 hypothetical protein NS226_04190 [Aureimonas ureilytica]
MPKDVCDEEKLRVMVSLRLTQAEHAGLTALAHEHQTSQSQMLRRLIRTASGLPDVPDAQAIQTLKASGEELRRIGVNLNQAVRALHEGRAHFQKELSEGLLLVSRIVSGMQQTLEQSARLAQQSARQRLAREG